MIKVTTIFITLLITSSCSTNKITKNNQEEQTCTKEDPSQCSSLAIQNFNNKKYHIAEKYFSILCNEGLANSCVNLGISYEKLNKKNEAIKVYSKACNDLKEAKACRFAATDLHKINKMDKAIPFYEKSCELKNVKSCTELANYYDYKNSDKRIKYFEVSCELKDNLSCLKLGLIKQSKNKLKEAEKLFLEGCLRNDRRSCNNLIFFFKKNKDKKEHLKLAEKHCLKGNGYACLDLPKVYFNKQYEDKFKAIHNILIKKCKEGNDHDKCQYVGRIYINLGNECLAKKYLEKSCSINDFNCHMLGFYYWSIRKANKALHYTKKACEAKNPDACHQVKSIKRWDGRKTAWKGLKANCT